MNKDIIGQQPSQSTQKWVKFFIHLLFLSIIFILPEILMSRNVPDISQSWRFYVKSVVFVSLFYVNYYIIIDYCLGKKNWALRLVLINVGVIAMAVGVMSLFHFNPARRFLGKDFGMVHIFTGMLRDLAMCVLTNRSVGGYET